MTRRNIQLNRHILPVTSNFLMIGLIVFAWSKLWLYYLIKHFTRNERERENACEKGRQDWETDTDKRYERKVNETKRERGRERETLIHHNISSRAACTWKEKTPLNTLYFLRWIDHFLPTLISTPKTIYTHFFAFWKHCEAKWEKGVHVKECAWHRE